MGSLSLGVLGSFKATLDGRPLGRFRTKTVPALLVYLACQPGLLHRREYLMALLWPGLPQKSAQANLRQTLYLLRRAIPMVDGANNPNEVPFLLADRQTVQVNPAARYELDLLQFEALLAQGDSGREAAVELYQGDFLADFYLPDSAAFEEWTLARREELRRQALEALEGLACEAITAAKYQTAADYARRQIDIDQLRENAHRQLMEALARDGRRSEALDLYETLVEILYAELALAPSPETELLAEQIRDNKLEVVAREKVAGRIEGPELPRHNLPMDRTPLVGREEELAQLADMIADPDTRLITIVGPGGMGKTRLALAAARHQLSSGSNGKTTFPNGLFFVALQELDSVDQIPPSINEALGFRPSAEDPSGRLPWQQTLDYLRAKRLLMIMDNFEQLLEGVDLLVDILESALEITILVTSREKLSLHSEQLFPLTGLHHPEQELVGVSTDQLLADYSSSRLFVQSAGRLRPDFTLSGDEVPDLAQICRLVGGMPLGLELAAGWVELMSLGDIVNEIGHSLEMLETDARDLPERQRSMVAVFDSSWKRLDRSEQATLAKLSVFRGGFTRDAAGQVTGASIRQMASLVGKSLLQYDKERDRFQIHRLLRQYLGDHLAEEAVAEIETRNCHCAYYCGAVQSWCEDLKGCRQREALAEMEADNQNIRLAWTWAVDQSQVAHLDEAIEGLCLFYRRSGRMQDIEKSCQMAADRLSGAENAVENHVLAKILARQGWILNDELDITLLQKSLNLLQELERQGYDVRAEKAFAFLRLGKIKVKENVEEADMLLSQSLILYQSLNDSWSEACVLHIQAYIAWWLGSFEVAQKLCERSMLKRDAIKDQTGRTESLLEWALTAKELGDRDKALAVYMECLGIYQESGNLQGIAYANRLTALAMMESGRLNEAGLAFSKSFKLYEELGMDWSVLRIFVHWKETLQGNYGWVGEYYPLEGNLPISGIWQAHLLQYLGRVAIAECRYREGEYLLKRSLALFQKHKKRIDIALALISLVLTLLGLGEVEESTNQLSVAIKIGLETKGAQVLQNGLPVIAALYVHLGQPERAVMIYEAALQFPYVANSQWFEDVVGKHIKGVEAELPPQVVAEAKACGRGVDPWETMEELYREFNNMPALSN